MDWLVTYSVTKILIPLARILSFRQINWLASAIGQIAYFFVPRRRKAAMHNLRRFYRGEKNESELRRIARRSSQSLALAAFECVRFRRYLDTPDETARRAHDLGEISAALAAIRAAHKASNGCVFVTAHVGAYSILPYLFALAGVPLTVPINPLRNRLLQNRWCPLDRERAPGSEMFVAKKDALKALVDALKQGRSVGVLADQRPAGTVPFYPRNMSVVTTPIPLLLALRCSRPIIVGACYRLPSAERYEIRLSEPLWPSPSSNDESELRRLGLEIDGRLAALVREHSGQYLWMHNRWQAHRLRKDAAADR